MLDLGTLAAHIKLDGAGDVKTQLTGLADTVNKTAEQFGVKLPDGFNKAAVATAGVVAGLAVVGKALWDCANEAAAYGDAVDKNSQKMGISASAYQEWAYVLERNGSSIDTLATGIKTLDKKLAEGSDAFDALGVSITDANGNMRSSEDIMNDALLALAGMEDETQRTALATELFGAKVAQDLKPMLNSGSESIEELKQRANDLGMVMSDEGVANSAAFQDAMTDLHGALDGVKNTIGVAVLPILTTLINVIAQIIPVVSAVVSGVVSGIGTLISDMGALLSAVGSSISGVIQWFKNLPSRITSALGNVGDLLKNAGKQIIEGFLKGLTDAFNGVKDFVGGIGKWIAEHKGPKQYDLGLLVPAGGWIMEGLESGLEAGIPSLRRTLQGISNTISGTNFSASANLAVAGSGSGLVGSSNNTTYNVYINGTRINDDVAIESKFAELMTMLARKGSM